MNSLQLLRLADNPTQQAGYIYAHRQHERIPLTATPRPEEYAWLIKLAISGYMVRAALEELTPDDIISLWGKKYPEGAQRGPRPNFFYQVAWAWHSGANIPLAILFRDLVLPALIETGEIPPDDKTEEANAHKRFDDAMTRLRKHPRN